MYNPSIEEEVLQLLNKYKTINNKDYLFITVQPKLVELALLILYNNNKHTKSFNYREDAVELAEEAILNILEKIINQPNYNIKNIKAIIRYQILHLKYRVHPSISSLKFTDIDNDQDNIKTELPYTHTIFNYGAGIDNSNKQYADQYLTPKSRKEKDEEIVRREEAINKAKDLYRDKIK
jgi:hypothetical protein